MTLTLSDILTALLTGALPTLIWLWFWLSEDHKRPEPRVILALVFIIGSLAVLLVLPLQHLAAQMLQSLQSWGYILASASIEEVVKFSVIGIFLASTPFADEPIDYAIYFVTGALGFAALENTIYLLDPIRQSLAVETLTISSLRFLGSTLLHATTAALVGLLLGFAWKKPKRKKLLVFLGGLILAVLLHAVFNFFIINGSTRAVFGVLAGLWIFAISSLYLFERVRHIRI